MGCHVLLQCMKVKSEREVAQSCPTLHDPMDCSLPGSSVHGIFQARVLEWVPSPSPRVMLVRAAVYRVAQSRTRLKRLSSSSSSFKELEKAMAPTPVLLPGKSNGQRSLAGCSPWGRLELDTTEQLHFHFSLSCIGEGNGNPLQCSCLQNPRDGGAWWAAVYGVSESDTTEVT